MNGRWRTALPSSTVAALAILATGGCATKGYVHSQVAALRTEMRQADSTLDSEVTQTRSQATDALARAGDAALRADSSWELALGNTDYTEAWRGRVYFAFDSAELDGDAAAMLDVVGRKIQSEPKYLVELYGFADPAGSQAYNLDLGRRRADAVRRYLAARTPGQLHRFHVASYGESPPADHVMGSGDPGQQRQVLILLVERTPRGEGGPLTRK